MKPSKFLCGIVTVIGFISLASALPVDQLEKQVDSWQKDKEKTSVLNPDTLQEVQPEAPVLPQKVYSSQLRADIRQIQGALRKGDTAFTSGDYISARESYKTASQFNKEDATIIRKIGMCDAALESLSQASELFSSGEYPSAIPAYQKVLVINSKDRKIADRLVLSYKLQQRKSQASEQFAKYNYRDALGLYRQILAANAGDLQSKSEADRCAAVLEEKDSLLKAFRLGNYEPAVEKANWVISQSPKDPLALDVLGKSRRIMEYRANAENEFNAGNYTGALKQVLLAEGLNALDPALRGREKVVRQAIGYQSEAELCASLGEYNRLIGIKKSLETINPQNMNIAREISFYQDAIGLLEEAVRLYRDEEFESARTQFEKVLAINPKDSRVKAWMAQGQEAIALRDAAKTAFATGKYAGASQLLTQMQEVAKIEPPVMVKTESASVAGGATPIKVALSAQIKGTPRTVVAIVGGKTISLKSAGGRQWQGQVFAEKKGTGTVPIKVQVALTNGQLLTAFGDLKIQIKPVSASIPPEKALDTWLFSGKSVATANEKQVATVNVKAGKSTAKGSLDWLF
jgi:hypothetical protein